LDGAQVASTIIAYPNLYFGNTKGNWEKKKS